MTIAVCLQTLESITFATDSALTTTSGPNITGVYNTTPKIFNLHAGSAIGAMSWGTHSFGNTVLNVIMKDFRDHLTGSTLPDSSIDITNCTVLDVAIAFSEYLFTNHIAGDSNRANASTGFLIAGFCSSTGEKQIIELQFGGCSSPVITDTSDQAIIWAGDGQSLTRLVNGYSPVLTEILSENNIDPGTISKIITEMNVASQSIIDPFMPIQEVIDLAAFLVNTASGYSRFTPGPSTIGGPLEIAIMTKHELFKWIKRKHYYNKELNN
jgi:hypothetical protein